MSEVQQKDNKSEVSAAKSQLAIEGWCLVPAVLSDATCAEILDRLWAAAQKSAQSGIPNFLPNLDPNASNVRVFNLLEWDNVFRELIRHPTALEFVKATLGPNYLISNFTANIARPGSGSMALHSDQAIVVPEPWLEPWAINIIWCLTDVCFENGATLFIPGSHKVSRISELGPDPAGRLRPFEAKAGSIVVMDGRLWHTSGRNVTENDDRALLFGYYTRQFLRPQWNWNVSLSPDIQNSLDPDFREVLGLNVVANLKDGAELTGQNIGHAFGTGKPNG